MNKFCLLLSILCVFIFTGLVFASDSAIDNSNWGISNSSQSNQQFGEEAEQVWEEEKTNFIDKNYGSQYSPGYLNTTETPQTEYQYDSDAGTETDYDSFENR